MNTRAFVLKTEGSLVWLAAEPESCSICSADGVKRSSCDACELHTLPPFTAKNTRGLDLKPGMKVAAAFPQGRALAQGAASFGIPIAAALIGYIAAPAAPLAAKPAITLAALLAAAIAVCALSSVIKKRFPQIYGEMEIIEILERPTVRFFPRAASGKSGELSQSPWHSG